MASCILHILLQSLRLAFMNVLLVVFDTTDALELSLVRLSQLELVESLAKHAVMTDLKWLAWISQT